MKTLCTFALCVLAGLAAQAGDATRSRMVVANFRPATGDTFYWRGTAESAATWVSSLADRLNELLAQSGKYVMIDRKFDAEIRDEIARLSDKNASKDDSVRLGKRLGTDYMIVGDVRFGKSAAPVVNPVTGQAMPVASQAFAVVSYRLIHAPTGEIGWADTVKLDAGEFVSADMLSFMTDTTDIAARRIVDGLMTKMPASGRGPQTVTAPAPGTSPTPVRGTPAGGVVTPF